MAASNSVFLANAIEGSVESVEAHAIAGTLESTFDGVGRKLSAHITRLVNGDDPW